MKTLEEIYAGLKAEFEEASGVKLNDGGDMALRFRALAAQLVSLWAQTEFVSRQCFPQTATGEYLDYHAELRGLKRGGAQKAHGTIRFMISSQRSEDILIPAGTVCMSDDGAEFETTERAYIFAGNRYCDVSAQAMKAGKEGDVPPDSIVHMVAPPSGVEVCTNNAAFTGGSDGESDDELRERVIASFKTLQNGGNAAYYRNIAMNVDGVAQVNVVPRARGRGTVDVVVASTTGTISAKLLSAVARALNTQREICVDIDVRGASTVNIDFELQIETAEGYESTDVFAEVESRLTEYCSGERMGKDVLVADIANIIYSTKGVKNYKIVMPSADIEVGENDVPKLSSIEISGVG